jgi:hypothetical protein
MFIKFFSAGQSALQRCFHRARQALNTVLETAQGWARISLSGPAGQRNKEGAGEGITSACWAWACGFPVVANASDHQFVISSKANGKQNGDI